MVSGVNAIEVATCNNPPNYCYNCTQTRSSVTCKIKNTLQSHALGILVGTHPGNAKSADITVQKVNGEI